MMPGIDPKKMQAMMKQMGIAQEEINSNRVIIERDEGNIIIDNPNVIKVKMQGQESFQITGDVVEQGTSDDTEVEGQEEAGINEDDVQLVMEKTGKSEDEVRKALEKHEGDLSEAIMELEND